MAKANNIKNRAILMERERIANRNGMNLGNINYKKNLFIIVSDDGKNHCIADFLKKKRLLNRIVLNH